MEPRVVPTELQPTNNPHIHSPPKFAVPVLPLPVMLTPNTKFSSRDSSTTVALPHTGLPTSAPELSDTSNTTATIRNVQTPRTQDASDSDETFSYLFQASSNALTVRRVSPSQTLQPTESLSPIEPHTAYDEYVVSLKTLHCYRPLLLVPSFVKELLSCGNVCNSCMYFSSFSHYT